MHASSPKSPAPPPVGSGRIDQRLTQKPLTGRRAVRLIAVYTLVVTVGGGLLVWLLDRSEFDHLGTALWFALQTVTTVGYGDVTPKDTAGRLIGSVLMLSGISILAVITASITAALIENARRRSEALAGREGRDQSAQLEQINGRLDSIETSLRELRSPSSSGGAGSSSSERPT